MAYENVNVTLLKNTIKKYKDLVNSLPTKNIKLRIESGELFNGEISGDYKKAINKLINKRYQPFLDKLDDFLKAADNIQKLQEYQRKNRELKKSNNNTDLSEDAINYNNNTIQEK